MLSASPWQNQLERCDVDNNGTVDVVDAVIVINELYTEGARVLDPTAPPPGEVTVVLDTYIATVGGTPFGFDGSVREQLVPVTFTYNTSTPDVNPATDRGAYPHTGGGGGFTANILGKILTGSTSPYLQVENSLSGPDTFRFIDGPRPVGAEGGVMKVDGVPDPEAQVWIALVDGTGAAFSDDNLPDPLPFTQPPLSDGVPWYFPHTISLRDATGTLLLQLNDIYPKPEVQLPKVDPPYMDVDGDRDLDVTDAVIVINELYSALGVVPAAVEAPLEEIAEGEPTTKSVVSEVASAVVSTETASATISTEVDRETAALASIRISVEAAAQPSLAADESPVAADEDAYVAEADQYFTTALDADDSDDTEFATAAEEESSEIDAVFSGLTEPVTASEWWTE